MALSEDEVKEIISQFRDLGVLVAISPKKNIDLAF